MFSLLLTSMAFGAGGDLPTHAYPQYLITTALMTGDPLGSIEDRSIRVVSKSQFTTINDQYVSIENSKLNQNEIDYSDLKFNTTTRLQKDGSIHLRMQIALSKPNPTPIQIGGGKTATPTDTFAMETTVKFSENKSHRVRILSQSPELQTWMEVNVTVLNSAKETQKMIEGSSLK